MIRRRTPYKVMVEEDEEPHSRHHNRPEANVAARELQREGLRVRVIREYVPARRLDAHYAD